MLISRLACAVESHTPSWLAVRPAQAGWVGHCRRCSCELVYSEECGWRQRAGLSGRLPTTQRKLIARLLIAAACVTSAGASTVSASPWHFQIERRKQHSLAEAEIEKIQLEGLHCRSTLDGSNPDAVQQIKASLRNPEVFSLIQTDLEPEADGQHAFDMAFWVLRPGGQPRLREAIRQVDHQTCKARLTAVL